VRVAISVNPVSGKDRRSKNRLGWVVTTRRMEHYAICFIKGVHLVREHDRILRRLLAERANEWRSQTGLRRLFIRVKIVLWVWREAGR
jgi:hypothetical protein